MSVFRDPRVVGLCVLAGGVGVSVSLVGLPALLTALSAGLVWPVVGWAVCVVVGITVVVGLLSSASSRLGRGPVRLQPARVAGGVGLAAVVVVVVGGLTGVVSVLVGTVGKVPVLVLHHVVDMVSWVVAVLVSPVLLVVLLWGIAGRRVWSRATLSRLGGLYVPLLVVVAAVSGLAVGVWQVTGLTSGATVIIARGVGLVVVVGMGLCVSVAVFGRVNTAGRRFVSTRPRHAVRSAVLIGGGVSPVRRIAMGSVVVVVGVTLVAGLSPSGVAHAAPAGIPSVSPVHSAVPLPGGMATNTVPGSGGGSGSALRDPQPYYQTPVAPGPVVSADGGSVTFQTGPQSYQTVLGGVQTTYTDADGVTHLVDNTLVPHSVGGVVSFTNAANGFQVSIPGMIDAGHGVVFTRGGYQLELIPTSGDYSKPVAKGNAILFNDVYPGIDVQYTLVGSVIKEDIVVNQVTTIPGFGFTIKVNSALDVGSEAAGTLAARATTAADGVAAGDVVFDVSAPLMVDGAGVVSTGVSMSTSGSGVSAAVMITVDQEWLADGSRVFPVRIDPTVDIAPAAVTLVGVEQGAPNTRIGDNGYPYVGYDDGITSHNIALYNTLHMMTRTYVGISYDFQSIMREARIDSATFSIHHYTDWSHGASVFGLYTVDSGWDPGSITWNNQLGLTSTIVPSPASNPQNANASTGWLNFDVRETVNNWVQGIQGQDGFVIKATDERSM
ncbi:MAG: DNRLRE domain-containing protein, partial [Propionibacteriaceae bacterium]|nr:DNRLRE domain-containing protein [Propionibacteriaceae bacterium]